MHPAVKSIFNGGDRFYQFTTLPFSIATVCQCQENTHLVESLGWMINFEKSDLVPTQEVKFLGYNFDFRVALVFSTQKEIQVDRLLKE